MGPDGVSEMKRCADWTTRMYEAINEQRYHTFTWGRSDCFLFAANIVQAITGEDLAKDIRGKYESPKEAHRLLKEYSGGGVAEALGRLAEELGCTEIAPLMAQRGDVVIVETELGDTTTICVGENVMSFTTTGLGIYPLSKAKRAWRI